MKTIKKVPVEPVYVEFMPHFEDFEEGKIYISKKHGTSCHICLCGTCALQVVLPFWQEGDSDFAKEHGWELIEEKGKISFTPSVGNYQYPCKSHYIITKNVANFV